jgi:hypothetical protein
VTVQAVLHATDLPETPLDAAARFFAEQVPMARTLLDGDVDALVVVFAAAGKPYRGWQLAAVQALAREAAPKRVNGVAGGAAGSIDGAIAWLALAPGITGQLLSLEDR